MQMTYTFEEMKKKYCSAADTWKDMPETDTAYKKACSELASLVNDTKIQEKIKDCFGPCLDKYQMQGFIRGYFNSLNTFFEEDQKELPKKKEQITPHQMVLKCTELTNKIGFTKELCSKACMVYSDIDNELHEEVPNIEDLRLRIDMMSDYIARLMDSTEALSELANVVCRIEVATNA